MTQKELIDMDLHQKKNIEYGFAVLRVVGGWVYLFHKTSASDDDTASSVTMTSCFVPIPIIPLAK